MAQVLPPVPQPQAPKWQKAVATIHLRIQTVPNVYLLVTSVIHRILETQISLYCLNNNVWNALIR